MSRDGNFDVERFFAAIDGVRAERRIQWRQVAEESGVAASTLTRIAQGRRPDVDGLVALLKWGRLNAHEILGLAEPSENVVAEITNLLRRDPALTRAHADALSAVVKTIYEALSKRE